MTDLFKACLGTEFDELAPLVRKAHTGRTRLVGGVTVERGNILADIICNIFGMPPETAKSQLVILGNHDAKSMTWNRYFDDFTMNSYFYKDGNHLVERIGPIHMKMALYVADGVLTYRLDKTQLFGIPIPKFIAPTVVAIEQQVEKKYRFSVVVSLPIIGKLVNYFGDMQLKATVNS